MSSWCSSLEIMLQVVVDRKQSRSDLLEVRIRRNEKAEASGRKLP